MEWLWGGLLIAAMSRRATAPLAWLLSLKWGCSYASAMLGWWAGPPIFDVLLGGAGVLLAVQFGGWRGRLIGSAFVVAAFVHAVHWWLWALGIYAGVQYYWLLLGLFSAQVAALGGPVAWEGVRYARDRRLFSARGLVAWLAPAPRLRRRSRSFNR